MFGFFSTNDEGKKKSRGRSHAKRIQNCFFSDDSENEVMDTCRAYRNSGLFFVNPFKSSLLRFFI